jgi:5'(3')-deoxyribonucleotidase
MSANEFYKCINSRMYFWDDLPVYPWAYELLEVCRSFGNVYFASSPGMCDEAATGKLNWLRWHGFLGKRDMNYMLGHDKWLMANPGNVLIDDSDIQVQHFHGSGGQTILFPQPWNASTEWGQSNKVRCVELQLELKKEAEREQLRR